MITEERKKYYISLIQESLSLRDVCLKANISVTTGNYDTLKRLIKEENIDISHFTGQGWNGHSNTTTKTGKPEKYSLEEVFCQNSPVTQKVLRGYVERHQMLEYKCVNCGCNGEWQGGLIALEIDHIDGNNSNNELINLRYLCPNCHALTSTYRGRNIAQD